jgi:hypothetical protein
MRPLMLDRRPCEGRRRDNIAEKNLAAGIPPRDGQGKSQMAVHVLRNPTFFKAELAIINIMDGENATEHHASTIRCARGRPRGQGQRDVANR